MLIDRFKRKIEYVRISITDRCPLRCRYCMPESGVDKLSHKEILSYEQIKRIIKIFQEMGVKKFRFTGGEPFIRKNVLDFFETLELTNFHITTSLAVANLDIQRINKLNFASINVSLDTLNPIRYNYITRVGSLEVFLNNFKKLKTKNLKLNVVVIKDFNEDEIYTLIDFANKHSCDIRFIEKMDIIYDGLQFCSVTEIKNRLIKNHIIEEKSYRIDNSVAEYYNLKNGNIKVGFITPLTHPFCDNCNKIRIKANGDIKLCLFDTKKYNIKKLLETEKNDDTIKEWLKNIVLNKPLKMEKYSYIESMAGIGG